MNRPSVRTIAFYLPQFHPIPENDKWWGKGFTEWTNTARAKPLFRGHYQQHVPADLGFYDLRLPESRSAQANLARDYGLEAFCYYHYWFAGHRILDRPFNEVLASGEPDFPFCLCWANQTWSGIWHGAANRVLIEQTYPGIDDHRRHFETLLPAFSDKRYLTVDGKPLFIIYKPTELPNAAATTDLWREMAVKAGRDPNALVMSARLGVESQSVSEPTPPLCGVAGLPHGWLPIIITAVLFGLAHTGYGPEPIPLFFLGLILGYLYQRTHRILPCIITHAIFNLFTVILLWRMAFAK